MMYYCKNCHLLSKQDRCQFCQRKGLQSPDKADFCFLTEVDWMFGEMLKGILENQNIPHASVPTGNGMRSQFALKLENQRIFVVYEFFDKAKEILDDITSNVKQEKIKELHQSLDKLCILPRVEKKIRKKLSIPNTQSIIDYCKELIINADSIDNKGSISSCTQDGQYIFIRRADELAVINSATHHILSLEKTSKKL